MSIYGLPFVHKQLSRKTSILGLRLWILISVIAGSVILLTLLLSCLCFSSCRRRRRNSAKLLHRRKSAKLLHRLKSPEHSQGHVSVTPIVPQEIAPEVAAPKRGPESQIKAEKKTELRVLVDSDRTPSNTASVGRGPPPPPQPPPGVSHLGWLRRYTLREIEVATKGLSGGNVIGEGGHGIVYRGVLEDDTIVAVKNLSNNSGQAEKEFQVELAVIGRVKHKNLVKLLGYCVEGGYRMLVYEYVENGNLDDWLHGHIGVSPLTWNIRMNIILGTAKGLAYLHESLEPKVVHRNIKSSNILLDREWKPKMSDFGLAKLLDSENTHVTTRVMGTHGYIAPEYAWTGMLNEKSDTYSFGILIMEIISGRCPVDHSRPHGEVNLIDWLKTMVENRKSEEVVDPKLPEMPSSKALKHVLLVALMCLDPNASERPKMGQVIHMLEEVDLLVRHERRFDREHTHAHRDYKQQNHQSFNRRLYIEMSRPQEQHRPSFPFGNPFKKIFPKGSYLSPRLLGLLNTFEDALAERFRKLKPRDREDVLSLSWMTFAMELLCQTHSDIKTIITELELPVCDWDDKWIDLYLDNSVKLLDICIAFSSELSRFNQGHLLLQCALHNLTACPSKQLVRACSSLDGWRQHIGSKNPKLQNCFAILNSLTETLELPKVKNSAKGKVLMRAMYGVKVLTVFVCSTFAAAFSSSANKLVDLRVLETCLWAEAFEDVQAYVNGEIRNIFSNGRATVVKELEAVHLSVKTLYPMIQEGVDTIEAEALQTSISELGKRADRLSQGLDLLTKQVDGFFQIVLTGRDALLSNLRVVSIVPDPTNNVQGHGVS
ncbi:hypothetical protein RHMOL_Rhmol07G0014300 [Rhododendron molle]|uniref:Uncharacterized protein n=1 Tax=Rhododendron molle TaxID=49168 RepID=A0ACC0MVL6_RHOML|nr:hypothetical protein RHMOL_Rhmol07G0014300 [Rhododendron molle]